MMSLDYIPKAGERHREFQERGYDEDELRTSCRVEIPRRSRVDAVKPMRKLMHKCWSDKGGSGPKHELLRVQPPGFES